jgi:hypothetical protein
VRRRAEGGRFHRAGRVEHQDLPSRTRRHVLMRGAWTQGK